MLRLENWSVRQHIFSFKKPTVIKRKHAEEKSYIAVDKKNKLAFGHKDQLGISIRTRIVSDRKMLEICTYTKIIMKNQIKV